MTDFSNFFVPSRRRQTGSADPTQPHPHMPLDYISLVGLNEGSPLQAVRFMRKESFQGTDRDQGTNSTFRPDQTPQAYFDQDQLAHMQMEGLYGSALQHWIHDNEGATQVDYATVDPPSELHQRERGLRALCKQPTWPACHASVHSARMPCNGRWRACGGWS